MNAWLNIQQRPTPQMWSGAAYVPPASQNIPLAGSDADAPFAGSDSGGDLTGSDQ